MSETVRVFCGVSPNHEDAESQAVLEWSLRKYCSQPVDITWMKLSRDPESPFYSDQAGHGWNTARWATPFTGFRWAVPALCGFQGKAIYTDSDVMFQADVAELWNRPFQPGKAIQARRAQRLCVSLWDCEGAADLMLPIDELMSRSDAHQAMRGIMSRNEDRVQLFPPHAQWNCLDGEDERDLQAAHVKAIHYSSMPHQVHLPLARDRLALEGRQHWFNGTAKQHWRPDLVELFDELLKQADLNGYTVGRYTRDPIFGEYTKESKAAMNGATPQWGKQLR